MHEQARCYWLAGPGFLLYKDLHQPLVLFAALLAEAGGRCYPELLHLGHLRQPIDARLPYADEQTIGTGHVGSSGTGVSRARVQTGLLGVVEVNGVLRQYDGQGQYANDQPLRDVLLGRFGAPRK